MKSQVSASNLGVSKECLDLVSKSEFIDLHLDSFIPARIYGYDLWAQHEGGFPYGYCYGHADFPRLDRGGLTGAAWSITTNPFRTSRGRFRTFQRNLLQLQAILNRPGSRVVSSLSEYQEARAAGQFASMIAIQGGDAWQDVAEGKESVPSKSVTRITLVHLTSSALGVTSSPLSWVRSRKGLTNLGRRFVEILNANRIFVDLAHIHPQGFWDAVEVHDKTQPLIVTHTGVSGVRPHWRNLDDRQIKAVADTGGVIGIIFSIHFLARRGGPRDAGMIVDHIDHVISVAGEEAVAIGSDYDGMIVPPKGLASISGMPRLIQAMLDRKYSPERIQKVLGRNYLESFGRIRA